MQTNVKFEVPFNIYPKCKWQLLLSFNKDLQLSKYLLQIPISVQKSDQLPLSEYDFIIVGSGPAGCVLANRLSANPQWTIALIEAGAEETIAHRVPLFAANLQSTASNWNYVTEPQNNTCLGMYVCCHTFP